MQKSNNYIKNIFGAVCKGSILFHKVILQLPWNYIYLLCQVTKLLLEWYIIIIIIIKS